MKTCKDCNKTLPLDAFRPKASNKDGREVRCKECRNIRYNKADPRRVFHKIYERQIGHSIDRGQAPPNYTLDQLITWADQQPALVGIWDAYVQSGYDTFLKPSCDRLDNDKPYELSNLEIITWQENRLRASRDKQAGTLNANQRAVSAYNSDGSLHAQYGSIMDAVRTVQGHMWGISSVADGKPVRKSDGTTYMPRSYKGFIWRWS